MKKHNGQPLDFKRVEGEVSDGKEHRSQRCLYCGKVRVLACIWHSPYVASMVNSKEFKKAQKKAKTYTRKGRKK